MARKNRIVTNYHPGGRPIQLNHLLKNHLRYKKEAPPDKKKAETAFNPGGQSDEQTI